jgi:hypothetical protein
MTVNRARAPRVGLLFRGDRSAAPLSGRAGVLADLFDAIAQAGATVEPVVYADDAIDAVREQLRGLDALLVWVNPIQDGATRQQLDELLREAAMNGTRVSAHPDVIAKIGTKEVLYRTRDMAWGTDTDLYESMPDFAQRFPARLARSRVRVLKQARGNGGTVSGRSKTCRLTLPGTPLDGLQSRSRGYEPTLLLRRSTMMTSRQRPKFLPIRSRRPITRKPQAS